MGEMSRRLELEEWARLVEEQDDGRKFIHLNALLPKLTETQIVSLLKVFGNGTPKVKI